MYIKTLPEIINSAKEKVQQKLQELNNKILFEAASEYYVDFEFQNEIGKKEFLVFGSNYILIEFPFIEAPKNMEDIIFKLQLQGYNVVLAHPERYLYYTIKDYKKLVSKGVFLQLNLLSITGFYSPEVKKQSATLIKENLISFVGTDCHNMRQAEELKRCFTNPLWHQLLDSGKLLNSSL